MKRQSIQKQLKAAGWRLINRSAGHITITPSPAVIADSSARRYEIDRDDDGFWYCVYVDPKQGRCIDQRVPEGLCGTLRMTLRVLIEHVHDRVVVKGLNENGTKEAR